MKQVEVVPRRRTTPNQQEQQIVMIWNVSRMLLTVGGIGAYLLHTAGIL